MPRQCIHAAGRVSCPRVRTPTTALAPRAVFAARFLQRLVLAAIRTTKEESMPVPKTAAYALAAVLAAAAIAAPMVLAHDDSRPARRSHADRQAVPRHRSLAHLGEGFPDRRGQPALHVQAGSHAREHARHLPRQQPAVVHRGGDAFQRPARRARASTRSGISGATASSTAASTRRPRRAIPTASERAGPVRTSRSTSSRRTC